jgi:hypothetical protein
MKKSEKRFLNVCSRVWKLKASEYWLTAVIIVLLLPGFCSGYTVVRKDGRSFSGTLVEKTRDYIVVRDKRGITVKFKAEQIDWKKTDSQEATAEKKANENEHFPVQKLESRENSGTKKWTGEVISVDFKDIDIKDFFRFIAEISGMNMILDPDVKGSLTLKLTEVPWDQALDLVCRTHDLGYEISGNVLEVDKY